MLKEFHKRLEENSELQPLVSAFNRISQFPQVEYIPNLNENQIGLFISILDQQDQIRKDKLQVNHIIYFKTLISQIDKKNSKFYYSCQEQYEKHVAGLDIHSQNAISHLSIKSLSISTILWLQDNCRLLPTLQDALTNKFREIVFSQLTESENNLEITEQGVKIIVNHQKIVVYQKDDNLIMKSDNKISKQSEMIHLLCGFLEYFNLLHIELSEFLVQTISSQFRQYFIKRQNVEIDNILIIEKYQKEIHICLQLANLKEIEEKQHHFSQLDKLKQNLVRFKNYYVDALEKQSFKQQKQQNWNLNFFKQKTDGSQKSTSQFFEQLLSDWNILDSFLLNNTDRDDQIYQLIWDHLRLLDICLQLKEQPHNFQSLNFYVTIYTQIDQKLMKLLKFWDNEQLIDYIYSVKYQLRQLSHQANQYVDV